MRNRRMRQSSSVSGFLTGRKYQSITPGGLIASAPLQDTPNTRDAQARPAFSLLISLNSIHEFPVSDPDPDPAGTAGGGPFSVAKPPPMWENRAYPKNGVRRRDPPRAGAEGASRV